MKCPNCSGELEEITEEIMGEKFSSWRCKMCKTTYTLVADSYLRFVKEYISIIHKSLEEAEDIIGDLLFDFRNAKHGCKAILQTIEEDIGEEEKNKGGDKLDI